MSAWQAQPKIEGYWAQEFAKSREAWKRAQSEGVVVIHPDGSESPVYIYGARSGSEQVKETACPSSSPS